MERLCLLVAFIEQRAALEAVYYTHNISSTSLAVIEEEPTRVQSVVNNCGLASRPGYMGRARFGWASIEV